MGTLMQMKLIAIAAALTLSMLSASARAQSQEPTPEQKQHHLELFRKGSVLWPIYCNHCHNARNPSEFAPYQWDQILMHMRTMDNMPPEDADAILEFMKTAR